MKEFLRNIMGLVSAVFLVYCVAATVAFAFYLGSLVISG